MYDFQHISRDHGPDHRLDRSSLAASRVDANPVFGRDSKAANRWTCVRFMAADRSGANTTVKTPVHKKEGDSNTEREVARA